MDEARPGSRNISTETRHFPFAFFPFALFPFLLFQGSRLNNQQRLQVIVDLSLSSQRSAGGQFQERHVRLRALTRF